MSQIIQPDNSPLRDNIEKSRNLLFSTYVLMMRDRIQQKSQKQSDSFWEQFEKILSKHEQQMGILTQKAVSMRSNLSQTRKNESSMHLARMNKINLQIQKLQEQIEGFQEQLQSDRAEQIEKEKTQIENEIQSIDKEIEERTKNIENLRKSNASLKAQIQKAKAIADSKSNNLKERTKDAEAKNSYVSEQIEITKKKLSEISLEISELEQREKLCSELFNSLKEPLPSIEYIFSP